MSSRGGCLRGWLVSLLIVAVVIAIGAIIWFRTAPKSIDGIPCSVGEQLSTHYHAHLVIIVRGKPHLPPAGIGIHYEHLCFYWLHTHDSSGIIHIEAPHSFKPRLGEFFDIWGQPLSPRRAAGFTTSSTQSMKIYVDGHRYRGDPRAIRLKQHRAITIEIGPPFVPPPVPVFPKGY